MSTKTAKKTTSLSMEEVKKMSSPEQLAEAVNNLGLGGSRNAARGLHHNHLAEGEVTGHFHGVRTAGKCLMVEIPDTDTEQLAGQTDKILALTETGVVEHQEHKPIEIPAGIYTVTGVRERDHAAGIARRVID